MIDPDDSSQYENEAAYLDRYGLLPAGEGFAPPRDAFEPEVVRPEEDTP